MIHQYCTFSECVLTAVVWTCCCPTEVASPWTEETVMQCLYLYLALLPLNHKLVHELAAVYTEAIADIKRSVLRVIEQPVRSTAHRRASPLMMHFYIAASWFALYCEK